MIWRNYDVLPIDPNRVGDVGDTIERRFVLHDGQTGAVSPDGEWDAPAPVRPFTWTAFSREEAWALQTWLDARRGRVVPFWLPTFQQDLVLAGDTLAHAQILTLRWVGYRRQLFEAGQARRHILVMAPGEVPTCHHIDDADDPATLETETITITPAASAPWPASGTRIFFLRFCRLEEDLTELVWHSHDAAEAVIQAREIPREAPE